MEDKNKPDSSSNNLITVKIDVNDYSLAETVQLIWFSACLEETSYAKEKLKECFNKTKEYADQGNVKAQCILMFVYMQGLGVEPSEKLALEILQSLLDKGTTPEEIETNFAIIQQEMNKILSKRNDPGILLGPGLMYFEEENTYVAEDPDLLPGP